MIESIIICKHGKLGYTASLRFEDAKLDCELSNTNKNKLYSMIEYKVGNLYE